MVKIDNNIIKIDTKNTSYIISITSRGDLVHLYYGARIPSSDVDAIIARRSILLVNSLYPSDDISYGIDDMCFEYSFMHRGDSRSCAAYLRDDNGENFDFVFKEAVEGMNINIPTNIANSYGYDDCVKVTLQCVNRDIELNLYYLVYNDSDVITRMTEIRNMSGSDVTIESLMSYQLDFKADNKKLITFDGAWARERYKTEKNIEYGKYISSSLSGMSSAEVNPFFIVADTNADNGRGECFGFNLIYSGNHKIFVSRDTYEGIRVMQGINDENFSYRLRHGESFLTPEGVMTYSNVGYNGVSHNMHTFIEEHIVRYTREIPVMLNTWEAMYFDMSADKIKSIADKASDIGFETLVIDDGWFGERNDDTTSLGDWFVNKEKFPKGLGDVSDYLKSKGLRLGIWFEPEMISRNSRLYREHPEWALIDDSIRDVTGRGQYILDITREDVRKYLIDSISAVIEEGNISYLKWDFNRRFAEVGQGRDSGAYLYNYIQGLYTILRDLTSRFPDLAIEGCASGGGRFDFGLLCFCPFVWVSDNTNPYSRAHIQEGTSYGYPVSVMLNHVSASPNHQTGRLSTLDTRKNVAMHGIFGCQMDVAKLSDEDCLAIKQSIVEYKKVRKYIKKSVFARLADGFTNNDFEWQTMSNDGSKGMITIYRKRFLPIYVNLPIRLTGLDSEAVYRVYGPGKVDITAHGSTLMNCGLVLPQNYNGNNVSEDITMLVDDTALTYYIERL